MPRLLKHNRVFAANSGFSLVEAMVSILLLGIVSSSMVGAFIVGRAGVIRASHYLEAMNLLRLRIEDIRNTPYDSIDSLECSGVSISLNPGLTGDTTDDFWGTIDIITSDVNDLDSDDNITEHEIDIDGDGINDAIKPVYVIISWDSPLCWWGGNGTVVVGEELATLECGVDE